MHMYLARRALHSYGEQVLRGTNTAENADSFTGKAPLHRVLCDVYALAQVDDDEAWYKLMALQAAAAVMLCGVHACARPGP